MDKSFPCLVCGKELTAVSFAGDLAQPNDGVMCIAEGNYGSTVYDPIPVIGFETEYLAFNVCDECLKQAGSKGYVKRVVVTRTIPARTYTTWSPNNE